MIIVVVLIVSLDRDSTSINSITDDNSSIKSSTGDNNIKRITGDNSTNFNNIKNHNITIVTRIIDVNTAQVVEPY